MIDIVYQWPHFGHIIDNRSNDGTDILFRRNEVVGQVINFLCYFNQVGAVPKQKLLNRIAVICMVASYGIYFMCYL